MFIMREKPLIVLAGDVVVFVASLWAMIALRYVSYPDTFVFYNHLRVFAIFFLPWIMVNIIVGLYDHYVAFSKGFLFRMLLKAQLFNILLAVLYFYFFGDSGITPKTNLLLYLIVSSGFMIFWRLVGVPFFFGIRKEKALLLAGGVHANELMRVVGASDQYKYSFVTHSSTTADLSGERLLQKIKDEHVSLVVIDFNNFAAPEGKGALYKLLFEHVELVSFQAVYESVFNKVALSCMSYEWVLENISTEKKRVYDIVKRIMDIVIAFPLLLLSFLTFPFVYLAIKLDDGGPMFIFQERIGQDNTIIRIPKIRSMKTSDRGVWVKEKDERITRVGKWLRKTRIDELPQLFSVVVGDLSLVGPRPDILDLGRKLEEAIPYYTLRSIIKPGLSGWAQVRQEVVPQSVEETKDRLAYDLYYLKNRSFGLDVKIALQTLATLASRAGR